jgi:hypothetical protein
MNRAERKPAVSDAEWKSGLERLSGLCKAAEASGGAISFIETGARKFSDAAEMPV